jgi:hypothetical protein
MHNGRSPARPRGTEGQLSFCAALRLPGTQQQRMKLLVLWSTSALLVLVTAAAALTSAAPPPCKGDADCAFAGSCVAGRCHCRSPWTGPRCSALGLAPMEHDAGLRLAQNWTWGGSVIHGEDGLYHMFVMHLVERCGIQCCEPRGLAPRHDAVATSYWRCRF